MGNGLLDVRDTPVRDTAALPRLGRVRIRIEAELVPSDVEPDIERLVEVGLDANACVYQALAAARSGT